MFKVKVIAGFNLKDFDKINILERANEDVKGTLFVGDVFECDEAMCNYLMGNNPAGLNAIEIIEEPVEAPAEEIVEPEEVVEEPVEEVTEEVEEIPEEVVVEEPVEEKPKKNKKKK